jgi:hypothetical protein
MAATNHSDSAAKTNIDALDIASGRLHQARGVLSMLATAGLGDRAFSGLTHETVMSSIWALQALLDQAHAAVGEINVATAAV